ncbi:MAG: DeoR family transcriptional regulator [Candidatus Pacebacteria bacterium]|nr:DeoR family transcriptional regulator [Candidatus Paceibacterota bacterium]
MRTRSMNTENNFHKTEIENDFFRFLEIKTEKLVTAVYMITNFLSDREPIKWKLRDICLSTLSNASVLKEKNSAEQSNVLTAILASGREIVSLLEIAHLSGFISEMNYAVLKREYATIMQQIAGREEVKKAINKVSLPDEFFMETESERLSSPYDKYRSGQQISSSDSGNGIAHTNAGHASARQRSTSLQKDVFGLKDKIGSLGSGANDFLNIQKQKDISSSQSGPQGAVQQLGRVERAKNKRREIILQMLRDRNELTIKDIATEITDCSEKTIQRELVALVQKEIIKKTGERRWSRYSLN